MSLLPPILYHAAVIDRQSLLLSRPWQQLFQAWETRVGGASAPTIPELAAALAALTSGPGSLAALTVRVAALEALAALHQGVPTVQAVATGAGLGAVVSVAGRDEAGVLTLTTASGQARRSHAAILTVTFAAAWSPAPVVQVQPANAAAWALEAGTVRVLREDVAETGFTLRSGTPRLPRAGAVYTWTFEVL